MEFDFSHLINRETVEVKRGDTVVFTATVREITHGEKTLAQKRMFENIDIPTGTNKAANQRQMRNEIKSALKEGAHLKTALFEEVSAIESWTLKDSNGVDVPVCPEAWENLPEWATTQIEEAIERLNPSLDEEFSDESGS